MGRWEAATRWREQVDPHFGFVADLGFDAVDLDDSSFWSLWVQYRSPTAAIRIAKSNEFFRCDVELIRLVNGEVPDYPIWLADDRIDWVLLDDVVAVRRPDLSVDVKRQTGLADSQVDDQLRFWAQVLRDVAGDFLGGDFAAIDEAGTLIRARVTEHPEQVRIWMPNDAPDDTEARQVRDVQANVPPEVGVLVRRYRRLRR